jgi:hypothetical protein
MRQHSFENASKKITVNAGDYLYTWVYLDPSDTPTEIMLQWRENGNWEHRAYWGSDLIQFWGFNGTTSRKNIGALPAAGQWVPLLVPANAVGLEGKTIDGMAFTLFNGSATWDQTGIRRYLPNNTHWDDYRDWINTRALGVNDANSSISGSTASLYSGLEFTQTYARDNLSNYYLDVNHNRIRCGTPSTIPNYIPNPANPGQWIVDPNSPSAPTKYQCVIDRIAPQALVNYFSYSSYETVNLKYPFNSGAPLNGGLNYCLKSGFKSNLDFALSKLPGKTEANFIVGEWGFDPYFAGGDVNPPQFRYDRSKAFFDEMFGSFNLSDPSAFHPAYLITWDTEYAGENAPGYNFSLFSQWSFVQNQWVLNRGTELVKSPHGESFQTNLTTPPLAFNCPQNVEGAPPPITQSISREQRYVSLDSVTSLRRTPSHKPR